MASSTEKKKLDRQSTPGNGSVGVGRIAVYSALGGASGVVPFPWLPNVMARRLRGALAQDIAARHGLSLTKEARSLFAEPEPREAVRGIFGEALRFASRKLITRFTPLAILPPVRGAAHVFALGHLLNRYIEKNRTLRSVRIDEEEAKLVRKAIDAAMMAVINPELPVEEAPRLNPAEDLRDAPTQMIDGVIIAVAGLPEFLVRRLDAAFDEFVESGGLASAS